MIRIGVYRFFDAAQMTIAIVSVYCPAGHRFGPIVHTPQETQLVDAGLVRADNQDAAMSKNSCPACRCIRRAQHTAMSASVAPPQVLLPLVATKGVIVSSPQSWPSPNPTGQTSAPC